MMQDRFTGEPAQVNVLTKEVYRYRKLSGRPELVISSDDGSYTFLEGCSTDVHVVST